jgi:formylglycine-generating enzyme required for sulfatase activity
MHDAMTYDGDLGPEGGDGGVGEGGEAGIPKTCNNTIRDGQETDVDCGGAECKPCVDGKACVAPSDCAGGSCTDKVCSTANCKNNVTDGSETDSDCGGAVCPRCTIGKRCKVGTDCASATCDQSLACACPPSMATVAKATGGAYCIDQVEVTKGQYNKFLTANVPVGDQVTQCKPPANTTFVPRGAWPPATTPLVENGGGIAFSMALPVHYVDWCDAYAYCKWSNKQLCGKIDGGSIAPGAGNMDPAQDAWFNACSAQGTKGWPYSTVFDSSKCNGAGNGVPGTYQAGIRDGYGFGGANQDTGVYDTVQADVLGNITNIAPWHSGCQGGSVNVYQMSGNVAEWEDSCDAATTAANCQLRGGSYAANNDPSPLRCDAARSEQRMAGDSALADVGIRCCLY